jgi:hypothetical protein
VIRLLPRAEVLQEVLLGRLTAANGQIGSGHAYGWARPWAGDGDGLGTGYGWGPAVEAAGHGAQVLNGRVLANGLYSGGVSGGDGIGDPIERAECLPFGWEVLE